LTRHGIGRWSSSSTSAPHGAAHRAGGHYSSRVRPNPAVSLSSHPLRASLGDGCPAGHGRRRVRACALRHRDSRPSGARPILADLTAAKPKPNAETAELARLRAARADVEARLDQLDRDARDATAGLAAARDAVAQLERRAANGETVTDEERRQAEADLETAAARQREPWPERADGVRAAVRDADQAIQRYVAEHFDALLGVVHEQADQAAADVDTCARRLAEAIAERARVEQTVIAFASTVRTTQPGELQRSRTDQLSRELERLAMLGGELPPRLRVDPVAEASEPEPEPAAA
jgi:hypothetical protein